MLFDKEILSFNILDVVEIKQKDVKILNKGRNFGALSFRTRADTLLKTETNEYRVKDGFVCYVPERLDYSRISYIDEMIVIHFNTVNYATQNIECFLPTDPKALEGLFGRIYACWQKKELGYKHKCSAILYEIFAECYAQNYVQRTAGSKIQASVDYIMENYQKSDLSIKEIAEKSYMSEVYFRKLFKKEYGVSPWSYVIDLRIQKAIGLISTGYYSLQEVAYLSGYDDYKHFSVEFKKHKGVSPSEYIYNF